MGENMTDPIKNVEPPVVVVPTTPIEPSPTAQPTPEADKPTGEPSTDVKQVPLPALQEERGKRQAAESTASQLQQEIADLRSQVSNTQMQQQNFQQQQQQAQVNPREELEKTWDDDPKKAVRMEIMYAMDWRDRIDSSLETQADTLSRKFPDFNNYRSSALGQVRSLPLNQRGGQGILEAAYFMVRGQNADTMIQQRETELLEKYRRGELSAQGLATPPGSFSAPPTDLGSGITDEESRVASAMGLTPEQYNSAKVK